MTSRRVRFLLSLGLAALVAAGATAGLGLFWGAIGGGAMSVHGWIAMALGIFGTVGLAWVLMSLAFRSDRDGWDDRADTTVDHGREPPDDDTPA